MNSSGVFGEAECRCRVTAGSQSPGIGRVLQVTKGHQPGRFRIREDDTGVCRTPEDTAPPRFGTVRPRVQIPGPRPISESILRGPPKAGLGVLPSVQPGSPDRPTITYYLDFVYDTQYRDSVKGHHLGWIYVTLSKQPKTKDSASSAPNEGTS